MSILKKRLICLCGTALFAAVSMVVGRFLSVNMWNMSIGFAFLPTLVCAMLFGPLWGGVCGGIADLVGALLFPFGPYFPGFTATAFLTGALFGFIGRLDEKITNRWLFALSAFGIVFINQSVCSLLLNTLWISVLYSAPYLPNLFVRLPEAAVMLAVETAAAIIIREAVLPPVKKFMRNRG